MRRPIICGDGLSARGYGVLLYARKHEIIPAGKKSEGYGTVYGTVGGNIPVYSDLSPTNEENGPQKKLEVATVPE